MSQHPGACEMSLPLSLLLSLLGGSDIDEEGNSQAQGSNCQRGYLKGVLITHVNVSTTKNANYMRGQRCLQNLLLWSFCSIHVCQIITLYTLSLHVICQYLSKTGNRKRKKNEKRPSVHPVGTLGDLYATKALSPKWVHDLEGLPDTSQTQDQCILQYSCVA